MLFYLFIDHTFFFCCSGIAAGVALFLKDDGILDFSFRDDRFGIFIGLLELLGIRLMNHEKNSLRKLWVATGNFHKMKKLKQITSRN